MKTSFIPWNIWKPEIFSTLMFLFRGDEVLLIRKKRGLGAGLMNMPGGKIERGESPSEGAIRETIEEVCLNPLEVEKCGELWFQMSAMPDIYCHVFRTKIFEGEAQETEEAIPEWISTNAMPYEEMWEDDRYWIPLLLEGKKFIGKFFFEGEKMKGKEIVSGEEISF